MEKYFCNKLSFNNIDFTHTNSSYFEEIKTHNYYELLLCISGNATLFTENFNQKIKNNTLIFIPSGQYHSFEIKGKEAFERVKISFQKNSDFSEVIEQTGKNIKIFEKSEGNTELLYNEILKAVSDDKCPENRIKAYGAFLMLISDIVNFTGDDNEKKESVILIRNAINYIKQHINEKLTIEKVAKELYVAPSTLSHNFKREMRLPFHQYVNEKRLIMAETRILKGEKATKVYSDYGFGDYSSFYKAYVKMFGRPPSSK